MLIGGAVSLTTGFLELFWKLYFRPSLTSSLFPITHDLSGTFLLHQWFPTLAVFENHRELLKTLPSRSSLKPFRLESLDVGPGHLYFLKLPDSYGGQLGLRTLL